MKPPMLHTAYKVTTTMDAYGSYTASGETALSCHFREINQHVLDNNEYIESDAMAWFEPDSGVEEKDILKIHGVHYQVEKVIKARRLRQTSVQFIKVELTKYGDIS